MSTYRDGSYNVTLPEIYPVRDCLITVGPGTRVISDNTNAAKGNIFHTSGSTTNLLRNDDGARTTSKRDVLQKPSRHAAEPDLKKRREGGQGEIRPVDYHNYERSRGRKPDREVASSDLRDLNTLQRPPLTSNKIRVLDEQIVNTVHERTLSPTKKYAKRPRHKTKEDKYEFKGERTSSKVRNGKRGLAMVKGRSARKKTGTMLKDDFEASNVDSERLTLKRSSGLGFLGKNRSSALLAHRDIPDLTFPEMTYLSKRRKKEETPFEQAHTGEPKKQSKQDTSHEISEYFSQANLGTMNRHSTKSHSKTPRSHDLGMPDNARIPSDTQLTGGELQSTSGIAHEKQAGSRQSQRVTPEDVQFHPRVLQKEVLSHTTTQESAVSWSVSPPRQQRPAARIIPSPAAENVLQEKYEQSIGSMGTQEKDCREDIAKSQSDQLLYQYTRKALMGSQPGVWRISPTEAEYQRDMSLDELKRLAQGPHEWDNTGANRYENAGYNRVEQPDIKSSFHEIYVPANDAQQHKLIKDLAIPSKSPLLACETGAVSHHIRARGDHDLHGRLEDARALQTRPSAVCHKSKQETARQDNAHDGHDTRPWPASWPIDHRNIRYFSQLEPIGSAMLPWRHTNRDKHDGGPSSRFQNHIGNQSSSEIHSLPNRPSRYRIAGKDEDTPGQCNELFHRASIDIVSSPEIFPSSAGEADVLASDSARLDQFDLELLGAPSNDGPHRSSSREDPVLLSNCSATNDLLSISLTPSDGLDQSNAPATEPQQNYSYNSSRSWANLKRQALSPELQPFTMFDKPYLLF